MRQDLESLCNNAKGVNISSKPIPGKPLDSVLGNGGGRCGTPINFAKFDFRSDCSKDKMQKLYEMTVNLQRGEQKYTVTLTKNVCDETMLDILQAKPGHDPWSYHAHTGCDVYAIGARFSHAGA